MPRVVVISCHFVGGLQYYGTWFAWCDPKLTELFDDFFPTLKENIA